ncbi:MAG: hypothetical protein ACREDK_03340 [Thermoplasmata archaeon]
MEFSSCLLQHEGYGLPGGRGLEDDGRADVTPFAKARTDRRVVGTVHVLKVFPPGAGWVAVMVPLWTSNPRQARSALQAIASTVFFSSFFV